MDLTKIDLNKPAFGPEAQKATDLEKEPVKEEPKEEVVVEKTPTDEVKDEEQDPPRVKYSRFKTVQQRAIEAEREAQDLRSRLEKLERSQDDEPVFSEEMPSYWKEMYGESEESTKAWKVEQRRQQEILERAEKRAEESAIKTFQEARVREGKRIEENEGFLDEQLESVTDAIGRDLTEKEKSDLLDIVDEYTPKDNDGNYIGQTFPMDKAWEIHELKQEAQRARKNSSRDRIASASSSKTDGDTSIAAERDKNFNPLDWFAYKNRLK
jgi:hypothetical protein